MDTEGTVEKQWVVHCKKSSYDAYVGRPTIFGNPFTFKPGQPIEGLNVGSRDEAVRAYEAFVRTQPDLMAKIKSELKGKVLACWCFPLNCHATVLHKISEEP